MFRRRTDKWLWGLLGFSALLNILTIGLILALSSVFGARLDSMDTVYRRCSVGIRWVETYKHQGKIIVVEKEALKGLEEVIKIED